MFPHRMNRYSKRVSELNQNEEKVEDTISCRDNKGASECLRSPKYEKVYGYSPGWLER